MSDHATCMYEGCNRPSEVILELGKSQIWLCREHFNQLAYRMLRAAERRGTVSLKDLRVVETGNGKIRILIKRVKSVKK